MSKTLKSEAWVPGAEVPASPSEDRHLGRETEGGEFDFIDYFRRHQAWSVETFGPDHARRVGVLEHLRMELVELEFAPDDVAEMADIAILLIDYVWRSGVSAEAFGQALEDKQKRNQDRSWPDWRDQPSDQPIQHIKPRVQVHRDDPARRPDSLRLQARDGEIHRLQGALLAAQSAATSPSKVAALEDALAQSESKAAGLQLELVDAREAAQLAEAQARESQERFRRTREDLKTLSRYVDLSCRASARAEEAADLRSESEELEAEAIGIATAALGVMA